MFDDRLEVDSPGSFAGMVKKENIRYTHFSRNPKIAAFLKDYGFVKEYGEGVDRMCRELNAIGLPDLVFDNNTFILKTTICSAAYEKLPIGQPKVTDSGEKLLIEHAKVTDIEGKTNIAMISYTEVLRVCAEKNYSQPTINNIKKLYEDIELNQIFNVNYISKILSCSTSTARKLIAKLRDMGVVVPVKGKGKGQYRFKYKTEM